MTTSPPLASDHLLDVAAEIFFLPISDEKWVVYAPLHEKAFVADSTLAASILDLNSGGSRLNPAQRRDVSDLLREIGFTNSEVAYPQITKTSDAPQPTNLSLFLTTACNLRCTYCYAKAGETPVEKMSIETAKHAIDFIFSNAKAVGAPEVSIGFHGGGEPTMNWDVLTSAVNYAQQLAYAQTTRLQTTLTTNGVLSNHKLDWLIANISSLTVSFDGNLTTHDTQRPTRTGMSSASHVVSSIDRLNSSSLPYSIRITVTPEQIARLQTSVCFIANRWRPVQIHVEPSQQMGRWNAQPSANTTHFLQAFREAKALADFNQIPLIFSGITITRETSHFCGVSQDGFAISPRGNVTACFSAFSEEDKHADVFFYGRRVGNKYSFDTERVARLRRLSVEHKAPCKSCFAKWHCGGDCSYLQMETKRDDDTPFFTQRCHIIRAIVKDQVIAKLEDGTF